MKSKQSFVAGIIALLLSSQLLAQDFLVSNTSEFRTALQSAAFNGQADTIYLAAGTYKTTDDGQGVFTYSDLEEFDLTIKGESKETVILDGDSTDSVLKIYYDHLGGLATIDGLTVQNGKRGIEFENIVGVVRNVVVQNNRLEGVNQGAGIYAEYSLSMDNVLISNNQITGFGLGAGVYAKSSVKIENSEIVGNSITNNTGWASGAGVYGAHDISIFGSTVRDNTLTVKTQGRGAGVYSHSHQPFRIEDSTVSFNRIVGAEYGYGVGIYGSGGNANLNNIVKNTRIEGNLFVANDANVGVYHGAGMITRSRALVENSFFIGGGSNDFNNVQGSALYHSTYQIDFLNNAVINSVSGNAIKLTNNTHNHVFVNSLFTGNSGLDIVAEKLFLFNNYINVGNTDIDSLLQTANINAGDLNLSVDTYEPSGASALIDAGMNSNALFKLPKKDILGRSRIFNGTVDIGPYEYGAGYDEPSITAVDVVGENKVTRELIFNISAEATEGRTIASFEIDYGFGTFNSVSVTSTYTYVKPGTFNAIIRVTDSEGDVGLFPLELVIMDLSLEDKLELARQEGFAEGVREVVDNPANYGLSTIAEMEAVILAAEGVARQHVIDHPEEFGLLSATSVQNITREWVANLTTGSYLVGSSAAITDLSIFDSAALIWTFQSGKYKAYSSDAELKEKILRAGYGLVEQIEASAGIWVIKE